MPSLSRALVLGALLSSLAAAQPTPKVEVGVHPGQRMPAQAFQAEDPLEGKKATPPPARGRGWAALAQTGSSRIP